MRNIRMTSTTDILKISFSILYAPFERMAIFSAFFNFSLFALESKIQLVK